MNYQEMSDFEINCAVAGMIGDEVYSSKSLRKHKAYRIGERNRDVYESGWSTDVFDPCNSWTDAGPIAEVHKISLHAPRFGEGWMAEHTGSDEDVNDGFEVHYFEHHHENPCRAICIVFLMMKGGE